MGKSTNTKDPKTTSWSNIGKSYSWKLIWAVIDPAQRSPSITCKDKKLTLVACDNRNWLEGIAKLNEELNLGAENRVEQIIFDYREV